jgi:hypothetical protein
VGERRIRRGEGEGRGERGGGGERGEGRGRRGKGKGILTYFLKLVNESMWQHPKQL